jgi:hypothetical protein
MIGCLVEAWCLEKQVDISPYGSWTHENEKSDRAAEPDECYVLGDSAEPERCDLAIEVIWTSGGLNKLRNLPKARRSRSLDLEGRENLGATRCEVTATSPSNGASSSRRSISSSC